CVAARLSPVEWAGQEAYFIICKNCRTAHNWRIAARPFRDTIYIGPAAIRRAVSGQLKKTKSMKITEIKIDNFRSIKHTKFTTTDFNIFVGQNNCGKTNFFEAVEFFFNGISKSTKLQDLKFKRETER